MGASALPRRLRRWGGWRSARQPASIATRPPLCCLAVPSLFASPAGRRAWWRRAAWMPRCRRSRWTSRRRTGTQKSEAGAGLMGSGVSQRWVRPIVHAVADRARGARPACTDGGDSCSCMPLCCLAQTCALCGALPRRRAKAAWEAYYAEQLEVLKQARERGRPGPAGAEDWQRCVCT